jgi:hypothetical protein
LFRGRDVLFWWRRNQENIGQCKKKDDYKENKTAVLKAFFSLHLDVVEDFVGD